jgi:hypothetical protein
MSSNGNPVGGARPATLPQEHDRALHLLIEEIDCACLIIEEWLGLRRQHRLPFER